MLSPPSATPGRRRGFVLSGKLQQRRPPAWQLAATVQPSATQIQLQAHLPSVDSSSGVLVSHLRRACNAKLQALSLSRRRRRPATNSDFNLGVN
ncbi:unnamed protein product [Cuscuta campestris]|uniref:Uncharacterized protein n=1 Tax=Cuscuta campestris TaxID=132261 RepID=A0A484NPZ7_9ASTE|nr:unnamed protein product [Cuscuta campestris]